MGDHTGYYNKQDWFPVFEISRLTHRRDPVYRSTYTGKPPDESAMGHPTQRGWAMAAGLENTAQSSAR